MILELVFWFVCRFRVDDLNFPVKKYLEKFFTRRPIKHFFVKILISRNFQLLFALYLIFCPLRFIFVKKFSMSQQMKEMNANARTNDLFVVNLSAISVDIEEGEPKMMDTLDNIEFNSKIMPFD
jgi:hypothetical protein